MASFTFSHAFFVTASLRGLNYGRTAEQNDYFQIVASELRHKEFSGELGLGLYGRFGETSLGAWSVLVGGGPGKTVETPLSGNAFVPTSTQYRRVFFQPALGISTPRFQLALSCQAPG